jgi:hypothetical protein
LFFTRQGRASTRLLYFQECDELIAKKLARPQVEASPKWFAVVVTLICKGFASLISLPG